MKFANRVNHILEHNQDPCNKHIYEGLLFNVNKLISDTIRVPEGDYIVAKVNGNKCTIIPTSESGGQSFDVFKPTLAGFFNPEIHSKHIDTSNSDSILAEA